MTTAPSPPGSPVLDPGAATLPTPTDERTAHILSLLEHGFLTGSARFHQMQLDIAATLEQARSLGSNRDVGAVWMQRWDNVETILRDINVQLTEMDDAIASSDNDRLTKALASWQAIQAKDSLLVDALNDLRTQALELNPASREEWTDLAQTLESHVETIHSCADAFRAKIELLKQHSKNEVDTLVQNLVAQLPNRTTAADAEAAAYAQKYDKTAAEIHAEQHQALGLMDTIKAMFLWIDTPEERMSKGKPFRIDPS